MCEYLEGKENVCIVRMNLQQIADKKQKINLKRTYVWDWVKSNNSESIPFLPACLSSSSYLNIFTNIFLFLLTFQVIKEDTNYDYSWPILV